MERLAREFDRLLGALARVPLVDLLLAPTFGLPTWLIAALAGLATVYLAASSEQPRSATALLLTALVAAAVVAAAVTVLTFIWTVVREVVAQWPHQAPERRVARPSDDGSAPHAAGQSAAPEGEPEPAPPPPPPPPPAKKVYSAAELHSRLRALDELSAQLDGAIREAHEFGHELASLIDEACRHYSRQEIIGRLDIFRSFTEKSQKELTAIVRDHPYDEIVEMAPWDYEQVIDKTGVLMLLLPLVPEHVLRSHNLSAPTLRAAGAEWIGAVDGFGAWIAERQRKITAQRITYHSAEVVG